MWQEHVSGAAIHYPNLSRKDTGGVNFANAPRIAGNSIISGTSK